MAKNNKGVSRFSIKKLFSKTLVRLANRIDFAALARKAALSEPARPLFREMQDLPECWQNAQKVSDLAAELTLKQIASEGQAADKQEIDALIKEIEIRYDRDLHIHTATTLGLVFNQIFEQYNPDLPFVSANKRDIAHLETLKAYKKKGLGVVYLINHNTHLDEFLVDLLWQRLNLGLPAFAAGQNMMAIRSLARVLMIGSYVVLRKGASRHQMAALYNYCRAISMSGEQQGIFLEAWRGGARSRDGSLRYPKRLVTLRGAIDVDTDLVIQPVALSFSAIPEDLPLCARKSAISWFRGLGWLKTLLRIPFSPRTFLWKSARNLYGRASISLPEPFLLSNLKAAHKDDKSGIHLDEFVALASIKAIAKSKKIMASQITAAGLLAARKRGRTDLIESVVREMENAKAYHEAAFGCRPDFEDFILRHSPKDIVADGLAMLKKRGVLKRWEKDRAGLPRVKNEAALSFYATHADRRLYSPTADQNIVVMGAGNWGFALACLIGHRILDDKKYANASLTIFDPRVDIAENMGLNRNGPGRFTDTVLPKNAFVTSDFEAAFKKASDVIIALKPGDFEDNFQRMLATSRQGLNIMISTRGFLPDKDMLPFLLAQQMVEHSKRKDVRLFTLTGPVDPDTLVGARQIRGVLAGSGTGLDDLLDLFDASFVQAYISSDPVGVQTADILARVYAVWINFLQASGRVRDSIDIGYLTAQAADEACSLAVHLGGGKETFEAGSIPWTATFNALCLSGLWHEFGQALGKGVKKGKPPEKVLKKLKAQYQADNIHIQALDDINRVLNCAARYQLEMPMLKKAGKVLARTADK
jgi:glycerol-3-phosphate dehydrogenase